jgi:hypothetical protein
VSKAQLVITAVILEGRTQADVARAYGVSKSWVSKLVARYHAHGEAAFTPAPDNRTTHHSASPTTSSNAAITQDASPSTTSPPEHQRGPKPKTKRTKP